MTSTLSSPDVDRDGRALPIDLPDNASRAAAGIAIVLVAQLMLILDATVVNVALPKIDADLGFGPASLSWVLNAYTLAFGGLLLLGGRLGDVFGRRRLFETGLAIFTVASLLGRAGRVARDARGVTRAPGRRRRAGRARRTGAADHQRSRRAGPAARARAVRRGVVRRHVARAAARRRRHRPRLVALDAVHQHPDRPRRAVADPAVPRRDAAPARPLRLRRRGHRDRCRRLPGLVADRRARARLDLGADDRRPGARGRAARRTGPDRTPGRAPDDPPAPAQEPAPGRRPRRHRPRGRRPAVDVLPGGAVHRARPRLRADVLRAGLPAADPGHLRDVAGDPAHHRPGRRRCR